MKVGFDKSLPVSQERYARVKNDPLSSINQNRIDDDQHQIHRIKEDIYHTPCAQFRINDRGIYVPGDFDLVKDIPHQGKECQKKQHTPGNLKVEQFPSNLIGM
jgi:hypothetical protein